jgi:DNA invertase Pin-like site-specific DNA recombinase
MQEKSRDVVVVRVSEQGARDEENFHSPRAQLARAKLWSEDQGNRVVDVFEEIDVSGKLPLAGRPGLLRAIEMVEAGKADHIVVAYFDRLVRSLKVQLEVIERVERAGGEIYAIDHGRLTNGTAATRMSNNMMGAAFQYYAEVTGEKVKAAHERAVARGVLPNSGISPGYVRGEDGVLVVERRKTRTVVEAFKRRDRGASLVEIQALLAENGIERSISGVASMLRSRMYLGEIHFGELHNPSAHEPIITDRGLFERVQRRTVSRGRQAKSERLLARLGVLRCGTCGSRMVINSYSGNYRCGDTSAKRCQRRAAVKADRVEEMVLDAVRAYSATADVHRRASRRQQIREADEAIERANAELDDTIRQLGELGLLGRPASHETLEKLTTALDDAHTVRARLGDQGESNVIGPDEIDKLHDPAKRLAAWRRLITDTVESVTVAPAMTADGRPSRLWDPGRIDIRLLGRQLARDPVERALHPRANAPRHPQHR